MNAPWVEHALCAQVGTATFYPARVGTPEAEAGLPTDPGPAVRVCRACPVTAACLAHAIATNERHGVWGGMTVNQRDRYAAQRRDVHGGAPHEPGGTAADTHQGGTT